MTIWICDSESDDLVANYNGEVATFATKFHCWVLREFYGQRVISMTDYFNEIPDVLEDGDYLVGHNLFGHDLPLLDKLHGIKYDAHEGYLGHKKITLIDSLAWSRELWPDRPWGHGLDPWGRHLGILKPEINDWVNGSTEQYLHRCNEDTKINEAVFAALLKEAKIEI